MAHWSVGDSLAVNEVLRGTGGPFFNLIPLLNQEPAHGPATNNFCPQALLKGCLIGLRGVSFAFPENTVPLQLTSAGMSCQLSPGLYALVV